MQRKLYVLFVVFVALAVMAFTSIALADQVEDPADNWCYAGGAWGDGRCTVPGNGALTEWYWTCGYYRAQVIKGTFSVSEIPQTCQAPILQIVIEANNGGGNNGGGNGGGGNGGGGNGGGGTFAAELTFCTAFGSQGAGGTNLYINSASLSDGAVLDFNSPAYSQSGVTAVASGGGFQVTISSWQSSINGASITLAGVGTATLNDLTCNVET
jgi:hypothetical protein